MTMRNPGVRVAAFLLGLALAGCGSDARPTTSGPFVPDQTTVIGGDQFFNPDPNDDISIAGGTRGGVVLTTPDGKDCVMLDDQCVMPQHDCGNGGTADVLVDAKGHVLDVICYPHDGVAIENVEGDLSHVGNNTVLVLDDRPDGVDVDGDVSIDGNNVVLYGFGPDNSVIGGNLSISKNNSIVRGVRIQGDVEITKNNGILIDCVIEGDLTIRANNVDVALCEVWGKTTISGNNSVLVSNAFAAPPLITGKPSGCNGNVLFSDANKDGTLAASELTGDFACAGKP